MDAATMWVTQEGLKLAAVPMTPESAFGFATEHFEPRGYQVITMGGRIGIRNTRIGGQYHWYQPVPVSEFAGVSE
ncbi:hypothetical protein KIH74_25440 [Kineosporia sp. J2-2]|uniref:Uncharacterized protein n=1 Tax=Kineosporia corallincola TaxID=2835133 RepID=A0ABS5TQW1_9ACTN|nr:hypothetical protein [Kineosporia corallincola]MBT0772314.1 hypothetical protein [Kineosporia corallincola]